MADKNAIQLVPGQDRSIVPSAARSGLVTRGRKDATTLVINLHHGPAFLPARVLNILISRTNFAICHDERRQAINHSLLILGPTSLAMVATDGHRLALAEKTGERIQGVRDETRVLITRPALQEIHELLLDDPSVDSLLFVESIETFTFHVGQRTVSWVKPTEKFPDYEAFMTRETQRPARFVVVRAGALSAAIQRVAPSDFDVYLVRLRFEHSMLQLTGPTAFIGEYEEVIRTLYTEETVEADFNAQYLRDFVSALDDQGDVRLQLNDTTSALEIGAEGQEIGYRYRYLCMPMRPHDPAHSPLPADFTSSVSAREFQALINNTNFDGLNASQSSMLVLTRESVTVVIRDGQRLYTQKATISPANGASHALKILVPHGTMCKIQRLLRESDVERLEFAENSVGIRFRIGDRANAWLKRTEHDWENDAVIPPTEFSVTVPTEVFRALVERTVFVLPKETSRYTPDAALLVVKANSISMVAIDSHRLSFAETTNELVDGAVGRNDILIAREMLPEIERLLTDSQSRKLGFADGEDAISCCVDDCVLSWATPVAKHKLPNYGAILLDDRANIAVVQASELREAIRHVCGPDGWHQKSELLLRLDKRSLKIGIETIKGEKQEESIRARYSGEPLTIGFYTRYILDFLDTLGGVGRVRLAFKDAQSAMEMRPDGDAAEIQWRYLVMPARISEEERSK